MLNIKCSKVTDKNKVCLKIDVNGGKYFKTVELKPSEVTLLSIVGIENVIAEVVEKTSQKTGEIYSCIEVAFGESYSTIVFLDGAEKVILDYLNEA